MPAATEFYQSLGNVDAYIFKPIPVSANRVLQRHLGVFRFGGYPVRLLWTPVNNVLSPNGQWQIND